MIKGVVRQSRPFAACVALACALPAMAAAGGCGATTPTAPATSAAQSLALVGRWVFVSTTNESANALAPGNRIKTFTDTTWEITQTDAATGATVFHHGGTYTFDGRFYTEVVAYATGSTASLVGQTFRFVITIDGTLFTQTGLNNPYTETWQRRP